MRDVVNFSRVAPSQPGATCGKYTAPPVSLENEPNLENLRDNGGAAGGNCGGGCGRYRAAHCRGRGFHPSRVPIVAKNVSNLAMAARNASTDDVGASIDFTTGFSALDRL